MLDTQLLEKLEKVNFNVNGIEIESDPNKLLIEACEDSGIHIPRFCWHKRLDPVGMCRMCLVEVETPRGKMLVPSCTTEVSDEMVVDTNNAAFTLVYQDSDFGWRFREK